MLHEVLLLLLAFGADGINDFLCVLVNAWVACVGAFDHVNAVSKERPWVRSSATIATKRALVGRIGLLRVVVVVTAVAVDGFLGQTGVSLSRESLTTKPLSFTNNGPDIDTPFCHVKQTGAFFEGPCAVEWWYDPAICCSWEIGCRNRK